MANPRGYVAFNGIGANQATFKYDSSIVFDKTQPGDSVAIGRAVKITGNGQVGLSTDGSQVIGKLVAIDPDGFCTVQFTGFCTLPQGVGTTVTAGNKITGALGGVSTTDPGYIRLAAAGAETEQASARAVDATDATAIAVNLG